MAASGPEASHRIIVLHGKDSFLRLEWTRRLREALREKFGGVDEFVFDGATVPLATVLDELRSYGLMAAHKLVIVDDADAFFGVEDRRRAMERYAKEPMAEATLLLRSQNWRPGNFDKMVAEVGLVLKCEAPGDADAARWCISRANAHHTMALEATAAGLLVERVGTDLARLDSELGKLAVAAGASGKTQIDRACVIDLVGASREEQAWEIQEAILSGNSGVAAAKVADLLRISRAPEVMIAWSAVDLARKIHAAASLRANGADDGAVARELRLWGDSTGPILSAARRLGVAASAEAFRVAVDGDRGLKTGLSPDPERALVGLCVLLATRFGDN